LLDGLPLQNHAMLQNRLVVDDPLGWEATYPAADRLHGTAMASLIIHGDLGNKGPALPHPLYVRPVMRPNLNAPAQSRQEHIPEEALPCDLIHQAVRRIKARDGPEPPAAPNVRIINLSLGDPAKLFDQRMSAWARLLDWLSWEHNVLFLVSTGNSSDRLLLDVPHEAPRTMAESELQQAVIRALYGQSHRRRLMSPSEAVNVLTIGALHDDSSGVTAPRPYQHDPVLSGFPPVYARFGLGYHGSVKPDLSTGGGKAFVRERPLPVEERSELEQVEGSRAPGCLVACPGINPHELARVHYTRGSSNATALMTRAAAFLHDEIIALRNQPGGEILHDDYLPCLVKCLLVHGSGWTPACGQLRELFRTALGDAYDARRHLIHEKNTVSRFLGYGVLDFERVRVSEDHRVTMLSCGRLGDGDAHQYKIPIPASLGGKAEMRRLVNTLAWLTPINPRTVHYNAASLWFDCRCESLGLARRDTDHRTVRRGTVQHEIFEGTSAVVVPPGTTLVVQVNCRADTGRVPIPIRYAIAATLEVAAGMDVNLYAEVQSLIRPPVGVPTGTSPSAPS
jgi:hypothetical protein